jgi:hypothetical protein
MGSSSSLQKLPTYLYDNEEGCRILVNILQTADAIGFSNTIGGGNRKKWVKQCKSNWFTPGFLQE